ncbi:F-box associated domain containing protein [Tanacetum coccineum]
MASENIVTIPQDIITDILHRLPAKSLGQFRRVSKNWLSLLSQPKFIKTHRNIFKRNHLIFISLDYALYSVPVDNHEAVSRPIKLDISAYYGSCNGLVFMSTCCGTLIILNPTTKEFVEFPGHMMINDGDVDTMYGFGYDSVTDDYKVVTISYFHNYYLIAPHDNMIVHVYSLNSNTWRQVSDSPYRLDYGNLLNGVYVNGFLHWIANNGSHGIIVAFSLSDEKFSEVASPGLSNEGDIRMSDDCKLVSVGEKLAIYIEITGEIWLMNEYGVNESWTKILVHGLNEIPLIEPVIYYDNGKIMFVTCDLMVMYDVEERTLSNTIDVSWNKRILEVRGTYVESLVSPNLRRTN